MSPSDGVPVPIEDCGCACRWPHAWALDGLPRVCTSPRYRRAARRVRRRVNTAGRRVALGLVLELAERRERLIHPTP